MSSGTYGVKAFLHNLYHTEVVETEVKNKDKVRTTFSTLVDGNVTVLVDEYASCHIGIPKNANIPAHFRDELDVLTNFFRQTNGCNSIWLDNASERANIFGICPDSWVIGNSERGNIILDNQDPLVHTRLWQWLNPNKACSIPPGATHNVGATAAVVDEVSEKILLVVTRRRKENWSMPGGNFDPRKDDYSSTLSTALRECEEETSIVPPLHNVRIVNDIYFPDNQFAGAINQVWKISFDNGALTPPVKKNEILRAEWIPYSAVREGNFDGLKIGPEIQAAIKSTHGLFLVEGSKKFMLHASA